MEMGLCTLNRNIFEITSKRSDAKKIVKTSKDENEVRQAEFIMFTWEAFKENPKKIEKMYNMMKTMQQIIEDIKR